MEEIIEFNGQFLLKDDEPFFNLLKDLDGEYEAKCNEKIFDTNIYVGADYHFNYEKLLGLFKRYEEKYGVKQDTWADGTPYYSYHFEENGGVSNIDYQGLKYREIKNLLNADGTITSNISVNVKGGKYRGWTTEQGVFVIMFFKWNNNSPNIVNYAKFTSKDKMKEFFNDLQDCIVCIDKEALNRQINNYQKEIEDYQHRINELKNILNQNIR